MKLTNVYFEKQVLIHITVKIDLENCTISMSNFSYDFFNLLIC